MGSLTPKGTVKYASFYKIGPHIIEFVGNLQYAYANFVMSTKHAVVYINRVKNTLNITSLGNEFLCRYIANTNSIYIYIYSLYIYNNIYVLIYICECVIKCVTACLQIQRVCVSLEETA